MLSCLVQAGRSGATPVQHSGQRVELSDAEGDAAAAFPSYRHAVHHKDWSDKESEVMMMMMMSASMALRVSICKGAAWHGLKLNGCSNCSHRPVPRVRIMHHARPEATLSI